MRSPRVFFQMWLSHRGLRYAREFFEMIFDMQTEMNSEQIVRVSLHDTLVSHIRGLLIRGELKPGEKVPEQALCKRFGVSRTPMREALKVLASEGVLQLLPNRGAIVAVLDQDDIGMHFPVMAALEALAGEMACVNASDDDIARLRAMNDAMRRHFEAGDEVEYLRYGRQIHYAIFELAGNPVLKEFYETILMRIHHVRFVTQKTREQWTAAMQEHEDIMVALEARDAAKVATLLRGHINGTVEQIAYTSVQRQTPPDLSP